MSAETMTAEQTRLLEAAEALQHEFFLKDADRQLVGKRRWCERHTVTRESILEAVKKLLVEEQDLPRQGDSVIYHLHLVDETSQQDLFGLEVYDTLCYAPQWHRRCRAFRLYTLFVHEELRHQGIGRAVLELLQQEVTRRGLWLVVGPVISEFLSDLLESMAFSVAPLFSAYWCDASVTDPVPTRHDSVAVCKDET
jgi:GNAT superfamily N-acetyltransferase